MAEKVGEADKAVKKRVPKEHNLADLANKLGPFVKDIMKAYDAMEEDHGSHVLTINNKFDAIAEKVGFPKALIRTQIAKIRRASKEEDTIKEMSEAEIDQEIELATGFAGTLFGKYVEERLEKLKAARK